MPQKPGRPPLDSTSPSVPVHVKLPSREYDAAFLRAAAAGVSVPEILRRDMRRAASHDEDEDD